MAGLRAERPVTLGEIAGRFGCRAHGAAILFLAIPEGLPLPVPSISAVLGVPLVVISAHLAYHGDGGSLPVRIAGRQVPPRLLAALALRVPPILRRLERLSRSRWHRLAGREHLLGVVCLYLSCLLLAPLPFFNMPPAACLVLLAWGMVQRDGAFVAAGLAGTAAVTVALGLTLVWASTLF